MPLLLALGGAMAQPTPLPTLSWQVVNDTVMGGVSTGQVTPGEGHQARFRGALSLEQNGGFVSIRSAPTALDLADARALRVTVQGDGRTWSVNAYRRDVPLRGGSYRAELPTDADQPVTVELPLASFTARSFGRPVPGAPALDSAPEAIGSVGFLLADKRPGPFRLDVLSIERIDGRRAPAPAPAVAEALTRAVATGVPAFNAGDVERCRDVYRDALAAVDPQALTDGERRGVEQALAEAATRPPRDGAWALRHAIDMVLAARR